MYGLFRVVAAFMKSSKSLEEAIAFFESEMVEKDEELKPKRRGGDEKNQNKKPEISSGFMAKIIFEWKNIRKLTNVVPLKIPHSLWNEAKFELDYFLDAISRSDKYLNLIIF